MTRRDGMAAYCAVTAAYWAFMLSDGALRMLVLLQFHTMGFSAIQLAYLFLLYEAMGIVTNLSAGWIAARFGLVPTLYAGLSIQILALLALAILDPEWSVNFAVGFVMCVQGLSGVAKDLSKMSAKSAVKILAPEGSLFGWVAVLTGSKNAVKGAGFLLGAVLLGVLGFQMSVLSMAFVLAVILGAVMKFMPSGLPTSKASVKFKEVFSKTPRINWLSCARMFLFGARDVWFVVGVPVYFYGVMSDGSEAGDRLAFFQIGTFMAIWIILYGAVQAAAPRILKADVLDLQGVVGLAQKWVGILAMIPFLLASVVGLGAGPSVGLTVILILGLLVFGFVFAINSSLHSYLILAFTSADRVTMDVGFYYMSNAAGRLLGTLLSGVSYQFGGLTLCLATAGMMAGLSWLAARNLARKTIV